MNNGLSGIGGGSGQIPVLSAEERDYYHDKCALLEIGAIETPKRNAFATTVGANETKYLLLGWNMEMGGNATARYDVRLAGGDPLPLRNIVVEGAGSGSIGLLLDPALVYYEDPRRKYYSRLQAIAALPTKYVYNAGTGNNNHTLFLPGPYGSIVTSIMCFDYAWVGIGDVGTTGVWPLDYELADATTAPIRFQRSVLLPISKAFCRSIATGYPNNANARGVITYVDLPSTWAVIPDATSYIFRDDFTATTLDTTTKWTRTESAGGNVERDANLQWIKMIGNGSWNANGFRGQTGYARSGQKVMVADVHVAAGVPLANSPGMVGWNNGSGVADTNMSHAVYFGSDGSAHNVYVFENAVNRGNMGAFTAGHTYRVRISSLSGGGATYEIQGGPQYEPIGGTAWTSITPGTSSSADNTLYPGAITSYSGTAMYVGDVKVY